MHALATSCNTSTGALYLRWFPQRLLSSADCFRHCASITLGNIPFGFIALLPFVQDRFQHIVPTLNKLGNLTVGLTLMLIGVLGILESRQHNQEMAQQLQPVTAEGPVIQGKFKDDWLCSTWCRHTYSQEVTHLVIMIALFFNWNKRSLVLFAHVA